MLTMSQHALTRADERGISIADVLALQGGTVQTHPHDGARYLTDGHGLVALLTDDGGHVRTVFRSALPDERYLCPDGRVIAFVGVTGGRPSTATRGWWPAATGHVLASRESACGAQVTGWWGTWSPTDEAAAASFQAMRDERAATQAESDRRWARHVAGVSDAFACACAS